MRFYLGFALLFITLPFLNACSKKSGDSTPAAVVGVVGAGGVVNGLAAGQYAVACMVTQINANCGTTVGTFTVTSPYNGQNLGTSTAGTGGSFTVLVPATTTPTYNTGYYGGTSGMSYQLMAQAGSCQVSGPVTAVTNGQQTNCYVCLAQGGLCNTGYSGYGTQNQYGYYGYKASSGRSDGTVNIALTGSGDFAFGVTQIYVNPKKAGSFKLALAYTNGNTNLMTSPAVSDGAWSGTVAADGKLAIAGETVDHLSYGSQVDASLLSFDQAYCGAAADAADKMAAYAKSAGFSDKAIAGFKASYTSDNKSDTVCVYPQDGKVADAVVALKSDSKMDVNRLWFAVVPSGEVAGKKFTPSEKVAKLVGKAKVQTLAALKKVGLNRKIASDNEFLAEELSFGFYIQK